ncbi:MAG: hypothetical protein RIC35_06800 [Marinoscillum sp.]
MKSLICPIFVLLSIVTCTSAQGSNGPIVRVFKNDLEKIYTVFFTDSVSREVTINLLDQRGISLVEEKMEGKGFSKPFGLSSLTNGEYEFRVTIGSQSFTEPITLRSKDDILAGEVTITKDYPTLTVNITKYNRVPTNIMVFNMKDELLKIFYWEPNVDMMSRNIDLLQFDGYEVRISVEQDHEVKLEQLIPLY